MRKLTIEQYVKIINFFIDKAHELTIVDRERYTYNRAVYFLKEAFEHQGGFNNISKLAWERLDTPTFAAQMEYIDEVLRS